MSLEMIHKKILVMPVMFSTLKTKRFKHQQKSAAHLSKGGI